MQLTDFEKKANNQAIKVFKECGLIDGIDKTFDDGVKYFKNRVKNEESSNLTTYVVYSIIPNRIKYVADDKIRNREVMISLDLFTTRDEEDEEIVDLRHNLEKGFSNIRWDVEYDYYNYDKEMNVSHYAYNITKIL